MIEYYEQLSEEEQEDIKTVIQTLYRQTFLLERKFEKRNWAYGSGQGISGMQQT